MATATMTAEALTVATGSMKVEPEPVLQYPTSVQILDHWERLLDEKGEKAGIKHLCTDQAEQATKAVAMAKVLMEKGCKRETAIQLSILALYDLVLLVGMCLFSPSIVAP
jgi:hypothetical protein